MTADPSAAYRLEADLGLAAASQPIGGPPLAATEQPPDSPARRLRWRMPDGGLGLSIPGVPSIGLEILCWPCWDRTHRDRTIAMFEMDTGDRALWVLPVLTPAGWAVPRLRGTAVSLTCGWKAGRAGRSSGCCRNAPDISLASIMAELPARG